MDMTEKYTETAKMFARMFVPRLLSLEELYPYLLPSDASLALLADRLALRYRQALSLAKAGTLQPPPKQSPPPAAAPPAAVASAAAAEAASGADSSPQQQPSSSQGTPVQCATPAC